EPEADLDVAAGEILLGIVEEIPAARDHCREQQHLPQDAADLFAGEHGGRQRPRRVRAPGETAMPVRAMEVAISAAVARRARRPWSTTRSRRAECRADRYCAGTVRRSCQRP